MPTPVYPADPCAYHPKVLVARHRCAAKGMPIRLEPQDEQISGYSGAHAFGSCVSVQLLLTQKALYILQGSTCQRRISLKKV